MKHILIQYRIQLFTWLSGWVLLIPYARAGAGIMPQIHGNLVLFIVGMYTLFWLGSWAFLKIVFWIINKNKQPVSRAKYWLFNRTIPAGLRFLALAQYTSSYLYLMTGLFDLAEGYDIDRVLAGPVYCLLLIISANGYVRRSFRYGYNGGIILAALFITSGLVYLFSDGIYGIYGIDNFSPVDSSFGRYSPVPFSPFYGLLLLCLLLFKYDRFFKNEKK